MINSRHFADSEPAADTDLSWPIIAGASGAVAIIGIMIVLFILNKRRLERRNELVLHQNNLLKQELHDLRNKHASTEYDTIRGSVEYDEVPRGSVEAGVYSTPIPEHYLFDSQEYEDEDIDSCRGIVPKQR